jgi:isoquinoline 1-oxidoreductase subunit beta
MTAIVDAISRRSFLVTIAAVGGGMAMGLRWSRALAEDARSAGEPWNKGPAEGELSPWLAIAPDNTVTVRVSTPEIGNGVMTQAAMTIAEELACDWSMIRVEYMRPERNYAENAGVSRGGFFAFFAGRSTSKDRMKLQLQLGASARERLKAAAAARWKVPVTEVTVANSVLTHLNTGRRLKYGDVAADAVSVELAAEPALKPQSEWTLLGKAAPAKLNNPAIVNGTAIYGMDIVLPDMVYAALRQAPVQGGRLKGYDDSIAKRMPGVLAVVVVDPRETAGLPANTPGFADLKWPFDATIRSAVQSGIAVVAKHYWQARKAVDAIPVEWDDASGAYWTSTEFIRQSAIAAIAEAGGDLKKAVGDPSLVDRQDKIVEGIYHTPYCDHATMEPLNGTALCTHDRVEVWHPSQHPEIGMWVAAHETGVPPDKVVFHQTYVGGGFGRRIYGDDVRMAVAIAKKYPGKPVHVIWSREESMRQGRYREMSTVKIRAGLDKHGIPRAFTARASSELIAARGVADTPYPLNKNFKIESVSLPLNLMTGAYRGPGYNSNAFFMETFIDECAHAAGADPLAYRLKLIEGYADPGWALCLNEAGSKAGWGKRLPRGEGRGIAIANWDGTTICCAARVKVSTEGMLQVRQLDVAFDTGRIVNRDAVLNQLQGGTVFGLNMALNEGLSIHGGRVIEGNFDKYPMLRMRDIPQINIHFGALSGADRFSEIGEAAVGVIGPAIGNAVFAATGKRLRSTPFRKEDLSWTRLNPGARSAPG